MRIFIETERLILRDLSQTDAAGMFQLDSDPLVHRYLGGKPVHTIDDSRKVIDIIRKQYINNGIGRWAAVEKCSGNFIGWSGLKLITEYTNGHINYLDVGYRFIPCYWGKGYAKEAAKAAVKFATEVIKDLPIYAIADMENIASRTVLERTGLQFIETFEYDGALHGWYKL